MQRIFMLVLMLLSIQTVYAMPPQVDIKWLQQNMQAKDVILLDMSDSLQYQRFHIPGAINLPYETMNTTRKKDGASVSIGKHNMVKLLGLLGITRQTRVIIYDDMGGLHAGRLYWELSRLAHPEFTVLDGGLVAWILAGNRVNNKPVQPVAASYIVPASVSMQETDDYTATEADLKQTSNLQILDVRSTDEYIGHIKYPRSGHVPGSRNWSWDNALDIEKGFRLKPAKSLVNELKKLGIDKDKPTLVYCRSGHRASQTFYTLKSLGFKNVKLYDASMKGYEKNKSLPLTKGKQP